MKKNLVKALLLVTIISLSGVQAEASIFKRHNKNLDYVAIDSLLTKYMEGDKKLRATYDVIPDKEEKNTSDSRIIALILGSENNDDLLSEYTPIAFAADDEMFEENEFANIMWEPVENID